MILINHLPPTRAVFFYIEVFDALRDAVKSKYGADITVTNMLAASRAQNALRKAAKEEGIQLIFYRTSKPVPVNIFVNERDAGARVYVNIDSEVPSLAEVERAAGRSGEEEGIVREGGGRYNEAARDVGISTLFKTSF